MENNWKLIVSSYSQNPRDVITVPKGKRKGRWFYVVVENGKVYVSNAHEHEFSVKLKERRRLNDKELDSIFDLYLKRKQGAPVSEESQNVSMNSSYWFGIFHDLNLH